MTEREKIDWAETDRIMAQLRAQLEAEEMNESPAASAETGEGGEEGVAAPTATALATEVAAREAEVNSTEAGENIPTAEQEGENTENTPVDAPRGDVPVKPVAKTRKKRRRMPKLAAVENEVQAPLDNTAREEKLARAAALAREQESDLFWRQTADTPKQAQAAPKRFDAPPRITDDKKSAAVVTPSPTVTAEEPIERTAASRRKGIREAGKSDEKTPSDLLAGITVEGLLSDIFGGTAGPGGRAWLTDEGKREKEEAPLEAAAPSAPTPQEEKKPEAPTPEAAEDAPTLSLDGYRVLLPEEGGVSREGADENAKKESGIKLFSTFSVKRQREGALPKPSIAKPSADQIAFKHKMEESEEDFQLLIDLDYENELGEAIGFEKILDYHERHINGQIRDHRTGKRERRQKHKFEYTTHAQDIGISKFYAKQRRRHLINLTLTCFLMLLLFFYERSAIVLSLFGEAAVGARYPKLYVVVGLLLFLSGAVLLRRNLISGFIGLIRLAPTDYSVCSVGVIATLVYHAFLLAAPAESKLSLYLSPAMGSLCLLALSGLFNWYREFSAFRVISSKKQKYALLPRVSVGNREGNAQLRLFENEQNERVLYARPVGFVRNYFSNTEKRTDHQQAFGAGLLLVTALATALSLFVLVLREDLGLALHTAFVTFLLATPIISVLGTSLPMFCATCLRLGRRAAIVGEGAVYGCGGNTTVVIPDTDCFNPMPHEQFELVKNCDAERATVLIRALLERIGSPLSDTVHVPKERRLTPDAITLTDIDECGVAAVASGERKTPILFGNVAYLQKYGIRVSPKKDGRYETIFRNMLCVAINNRLTALFIARYRPDEEMLTLSDVMEAEGIGIKIRSKDPGVHDEMLRELFTDNSTPPGVMKPLVAESDITSERVDATVVALGSAREAAKTLATCRRIRRAIKFGTLWQFISIFFGALLGGALVLLDLIAVLPPYAVTLYTFLFSGAHALTSYATLRDKEDTP